MADEQAKQPSTRGKSRRERVEYARSRAILEVADELGMELFQDGRDFRWKEHDSMVISPDKNLWMWFSRTKGGNVISLVEEMKEMNFSQAIDFLNDGTFKEFTAVERIQEPFQYYLKPYEQPFDAARSYLKEQRGLSDETIDFFFSKGVLSQANAKLKDSIEPVIVFKTLDSSGEVSGASLQGIEENWDKWPKRGYAKQIIRNSDGLSGMHLDIGHPKRLIFTESPIDLMSYYELNKSSLQDVRLVSMDGLKEATIGNHLTILHSEQSGRSMSWSYEQLADSLQTAIDNNFFADGKHADWITLAVDNDAAGRKFISELREKGAVVIEELPDLKPGQEATDWNDVLKGSTVDSRLVRQISSLEAATSELEAVIADFNQVKESITEGMDNQLSETLGLHHEIEDRERSSSQMKTYNEVKKENEELVKRLENRIKDGELAISFDTDVYLYDVFAKLGNSHPFKYLNDKRVEVLAPLQPMLASIDDQTIDLYKNKGTMEQDALYQALKPLQRTLGVDISTRFIGELAIAAYSTNKQLESLSAEHFGSYYGARTLDNLSQSIERILEYPLNETGTKDYTYGFVTTPNTFYHYLEEQEGGLVLSRSELNTLLSRLEERPIQIVDSIQEDAVAVSEAKEKSPEITQETISELGQQKNAENVIGDFPGIQEAAPLPDANNSQPLNDLSPNQTQSQLYLNFSTTAPEKSTIYKPNYHPVSDKELRKLNRYASVVQRTAQWYLENLADSKLHYFYRDDEGLKNVTISFQKEHFMHLTGIAPVGPGQSAEKSLVDFAQGHGEFENILISNRGGTFSKLQVLPEMEEIIQSDSFYFNDLTEIDKFQSLHLDKAILSPDKDLLVAIRTVDDTSFPASLLKVNQKLSTELESIPENVVMGIYRERFGELQQLSINEAFIRDGGQEMLSILMNKQYEKSLSTEIEQSISQEQLESLRNYFSPQMDKVETGIGRSGAGVAYRAYYLRNSYDNRMEIAATDLGNELSPEEQLDSLMNKITENYGKPFWDVVQHPDFQLSDAESNQLAYPIVTQESLSEVFGYSSDVITKEKLQTLEPISSELFTQVLDSVYNVGDPRNLGVQVPEESKAAWEKYSELSETYGGNFTSVVSAADQLGLVDKNSNFYQEWNQDRIYSETYHVRLQWAETLPNGPQIPFKETELVDYQTFAEALYKENKALYERRLGVKAEVSETGNQEAYIPFTKVKFDVYAPEGTLIKSDVRYDIGDETEPISRLLGLGYRRLEGQPELAAIDEKILSQLENQEVNQEIVAEANEQSFNSKELSREEDSSRRSFYSPKQEIKTNLAQRVEAIMAEDAAKILVSSIPQIQENLSVEGDLVGNSQSNGQMLYMNREEFGQDYQLELAVYSPKAIDFLEDVQAPWTLALMRGEEKLGYLAYGSDWGNDFQIEDELERLAEQIGSGRAPEGLYTQKEVDAFLADSQISENIQGEPKSVVTDEPFDYTNASAYEISQHAFQKIREYTQSPEDLLEYMDFMSKFPQLSPRNVALIHEQWHGANAVATYDQWQAMGEALGIKPEDVIQTTATYTNKSTGETNEIVRKGLSVKTGETSKITLFRPLMVSMIPVLDENGHQIKNEKGNPKYKKKSEATPKEKALLKEGKLPVRQFQQRDPKTGYPRFTTYKVFELSQTTLKPESYPKAMPNRHYNFNIDKVRTKEVVEGLCDYAKSIGVTLMKDEAHVLGNAKGAFYPEEQLILINSDNTPGEKIATTIHELAHATLHNPKLADRYKELPKGQMELEAEMTSHLLSKHFGLDTSEKAIDYIASWTNNLKTLDDKQLDSSLKRVHKTVSNMLKTVEYHTKPYQLGKQQGQKPNFPRFTTKGPRR